MSNHVDFHMHSRYSDDGEFTPEKLVEMSKAAGIQTMSIADHNCVRANDEAKAAAEAAGIAYVPSIEIDCVFQDVNFHLLGYGMNDKSQDFQDIEDNIRGQTEAASYKMLEATQSIGFSVSEQELKDLAEDMYWKECWTGEMFAEVLLNKEEYKDHPMLQVYRPGGQRSDNPYVNFYWDFYSQGKPCYVKMEYPSLERMVEVIHQNGGKAVLAHPAANLKEKTELLEEIIKTGIDGIEAYSSYHTPEQAEYYKKRAEAASLFVTCGSDFHGKTKPSIFIGQHGGKDSKGIVNLCRKD